MRAGLLLIAVVVAIGLVACGGDASKTAPLTLEQRVLTVDDAPDSEVDPVETRKAAANLDEEDVEETAERLHHRIEGAPPA